MTSLIVRSCEDQAVLELSPHDSNGFSADLSGRNLRAASLVSSYMSGGLGEFFGELAVHWRGWSGEKKWSSLEGELSLVARSDQSGHVFVSVNLREGAPAIWAVHAELVLEAGALHELATQARAFEAVAIHDA